MYSKPQIAFESKAQPDDRQTAAPATGDRPEAGGIQLDVLEAIEDLKGFIQRELRILREEIKNLRDEIGAVQRS